MDMARIKDELGEKKLGKGAHDHHGTIYILVILILEISLEIQIITIEVGSSGSVGNSSNKVYKVTFFLCMT